MAHLQCSALFVVMCLLALVVDVAQAVTQKNFTVTTNRNAATPIVFKLLLKKDYPPGSVTFITMLPKNGSLVGARGNDVAVGGSTDGNAFMYRANSDFPANGVKFDFDMIGYRVEAQGGDEITGFIRLKVLLRSFITKNYTLTSVDPNVPRTIALKVRDGDVELTMKDRVLASVLIVTLPTNGCSVRQFDGTPIVSAKTKVTSDALQVKVFPSPAMQPGEVCSFSYSAKRSNGVETEPKFVTLTMYARAAFAPRAYRTNTVYNVDFDAPRMLELVGSTRNPATNLTFIITKLPSIGQVFDAMETETSQLPEIGFKATELPLTLYSGPKTRVVLVYQVNSSLVPNATSVTLEYIVKDRLKSSAPAVVTIKLVKKGSPTCGDVVVSPVFWDRPVKDIVLNFTNPNARTVQKLILMKTPAKPLGDLLYSRTTVLRQRKLRLTRGSYFSDKDNRLSYQVRPSAMRLSGNETYEFRVQTYDGLSCLGKITFMVMQHDQQVVKTKGLNIRRELARMNSYTLLPLWGAANKTIVKPSSVEISQSPNFGVIYQLTSDAPYDKGRMYRVNLNGKARSYCVRRNCEDYRGDRIDVGEKVVRKELWSDDDSLESSTRFWILYKAPAVLPSGTTLTTFTDTFEYHFFNDAGQKSETQRVTISFRKAIKRVITCRYKAKEVRNYNFDHQEQTLVKCVLSNATNQAVMIPEFDKYRRHGAQVNFRLFQFRQDGNRIYTGDRLANASKDGVVGMWVDKSNTVLLVPSARARRQFFSFRASIFNLSDDGSLSQALQPELVRVNVVRENSPPEWLMDQITGGGLVETPTAAMTTIEVAAFDADDDLLQFRLAQGVSKGILYNQELRFGVTTLSIVKTGSVLRIPKGAASRSTATLLYKVDSRAGWSFPQYDNFTLYADDGGGVLSPALIVNITITGDENTHNAKATSFTVSYSTVVFALLTVVAVLLITLAAILRRKGRNKYMSLPTDSEMRNAGAN